jgi:endonuclease III
MVLANRPEKFLKPAPDTKWPVIVDYHLMRLALRLGLVKLDEPERSLIEGRKWLTPGQEDVIRNLVCQAVWNVILYSGKPMSEVDAVMWSAREYCPEMKEPDCGKCLLADVCEKHTKLFQPVLRTTAY